MDKFTELVSDLDKGVLSLNSIQIAIRTHVRNRKDLPEGIKTILCGKGETNHGLIYAMFSPMEEAIGSVHLAYLRGKQKED